MKPVRAPEYRDRTVGNTKAVARSAAKNALETCEAAIDQGINFAKKAHAIVWQNVRQVRDGELWRLSGEYENFEDWCQTKYGWSRQRGHQIADAAEIVALLPETSSTMVDGNERRVRELAKAPPEERVEVLREATRDGSPATPKRIAAVIESRKPAPTVIDVEPERQQPLITTPELTAPFTQADMGQPVSGDQLVDAGVLPETFRGLDTDEPIPKLVEIDYTGAPLKTIPCPTCGGCGTIEGES